VGEGRKYLGSLQRGAASRSEETGRAIKNLKLRSMLENLMMENPKKNEGRTIGAGERGSGSSEEEAMSMGACTIEFSKREEEGRGFFEKGRVAKEKKARRRISTITVCKSPQVRAERGQEVRQSKGPHRVLQFYWVFFQRGGKKNLTASRGG